MYCKSLFTCETLVSQNFMRLMTCEENSFGENYELRIRIHMYCQTHADKGSCKIKVWTTVHEKDQFWRTAV